MLRCATRYKLRSVFSSYWSVCGRHSGITANFESHQNQWKCELAKLNLVMPYGRQLGVRGLVGSSAPEGSVDAQERKKGQQAGEEKRLILQKKKEAKRSERIERQRIRLEKKASESLEEDKANIKYTISTKPGSKKDVSCPLPDTYSPQFVEAAWYDWWNSQGYFTPEYVYQKNPDAGQFVMCLPPPNVTGTLHLGHALGNAIQDAIARWHRMCGRAVLWNPGSDHAGIATQVVVEKKLWKEKKQNRHDIGRERFIEEVWKWKEEKGGHIYEQMKRLGSSLDWSRDCFTLDAKLSHAVNEAFIQLFDSGVIYRSKRLVNWSCALSSAISDIEVENLSLKGKTLLEIPGYNKKIPFGVISSFSYPIDGSAERITVATTRLETMLGDTAVAVHPSDARYSHLHGRFAWHPFCHRRLPIVCDETVDPSFGTGAVKVTPAHDHNDFAVGQRHKLEALTVMSEDGKLINVPENFQGLKRFDAREKVQQGLEQLGLFQGTADHEMTVPICSRSNDVIEFLLKDQWFVRCEEMANKAIQAVEGGRLKLLPCHYEKQWKEWLLGTRDWCISRQLWWGHQAPAYKIKRTDQQSFEVPTNTEVWVAAHSSGEAIKKASQQLRLPESDLSAEQDGDVLDTWFSSGLFPFSIFGWPEQTDDLRRFYPLDLLETASDIMFFWVARMVMLGEALTDQLPFKKVLFHSILRDAQGRKMSKSLGNIVDPMDIIHGTSLENLCASLEKSNLDTAEIKRAKTCLQRDFPLGIPECGADALRFALCSYNYAGHFINVDVNQMKSSRNFCNKIWQTYRFIIGHLGPQFQPISLQMLTQEQKSATDCWILSRLSNVVRVCNESFVNHDLTEAARALHCFWWLEFCDVYLEYSKPILKDGSQSQVTTVKNILYICLNTSLRLISPFMPFLTEELYQRLTLDNEPCSPSIMVASYPQISQYPFEDTDVDRSMTVVRDVVARLLSLRRDVGLNKLKADVFISTSDPQLHQAMVDHHEALLCLSRSASITLLSKNQSVLPGCINIYDEKAELTLSMKLKGLIKEEEEMRRLSDQKKKLKDELEKLEARQQGGKTSEEELIINQEKIRNVSATLDRIVNITTALEKLSSTVDQ